MTFDGGPRLRPGRRNPRNLYEQTGPEPDHGADLSIGWGDPDAVAAAVQAVNTGEPAHGTRWCWSGAPDGKAVVYHRPGADPFGGWVLAVDSPAIAKRITAAVNGPGPDA